MKDIEKKFPVEVRLRFESEEDRNEVMGQLSDGWGENYIRLHWNYEASSEAEIRSGRSFENARVFGVEVYDRDEE